MNVLVYLLPAALGLGLLGLFGFLWALQAAANIATSRALPFGCYRMTISSRDAKWRQKWRRERNCKQTCSKSFAANRRPSQTPMGGC